MLDFPSSPADGAYYTPTYAPTFRFESAKGVWRSHSAFQLIEKGGPHSNVAQKDIALPSPFRLFRLTFEGGPEPITTGSQLYLRFSIDGGATFASAVNSYAYAGQFSEQAATGGKVSYMAQPSTAIQISPVNTVFAQSPLPNSHEVLISQGGTGKNTAYLWKSGLYLTTSGQANCFGGGWIAANAVTHIRIAMNVNLNLRQYELIGIV